MKAFKYISIAAGLFLVVAVGFFLFSISKLPDPSVIKEKLKTEEKVAAPENPIQKEIQEEVGKLSGDEAVTAETPQKSRGTSTTEEISRVIAEDYSDIRVCENLGNPAMDKVNPEIIFQTISDSARDDSTLEAFRVPLKHIFQSQPVKELFGRIEEVDSEKLEGAERSNYLDKVGFYSFAAKKAYEIYSNKSDYEEIGDRAYHLYVISQIAHKKPELALDKNLLDFCKQLENSIGSKSKTDIDEERKELLNLIQYTGLTPKELGFNPAIRTKFNIELKDKTISFGPSHPGMTLE